MIHAKRQHPKTDELRRRWVDYVNGLNRMRWNIPPGHPDEKRFKKALITLMQVAQDLKSTGEIEEGDLVTNGVKTFTVFKIESDRVYESENGFYHAENLRIKKKFE